jgi:hypothetical protein
MLVTRLQGGESTRAVVLHFPGTDDLTRLLSTGSRWFFRSSVPDATRQVLFTVLLGVFVAMAVDLVLLHARDAGTTVRRVLALFAACYLVTLEITRSLLDVSTPIDGRLLGPVQPVLYALMLGILVAWLQARVQMRAAGAGVVAGVVAASLALSGIAATVSDVRKGFVDPGTADVALTRAMADLPARVVLVTNQPVSFWSATRRDVLHEPQRVDATTGQVRSDYQEELGRTLELLRERRGLYVYRASSVNGAGPSYFRDRGWCLQRSRVVSREWSLWKPARC